MIATPARNPGIALPVRFFKAAGPGFFNLAAIGSGPADPSSGSQPHWTRVMPGHARANTMPVVASNRIGVETAPEGRAVTFYGSSFVTDATGGLVAQADRVSEGVPVATLDLDASAELRRTWGVFRDRRCDLY